MMFLAQLKFQSFVFACKIAFSNAALPVPFEQPPPLKLYLKNLLFHNHLKPTWTQIIFRTFIFVHHVDDFGNKNIDDKSTYPKMLFQNKLNALREHS